LFILLIIIMKKLLLVIWILFSSSIFAGCGNKIDEDILWIWKINDATVINTKSISESDRLFLENFAKWLTAEFFNDGSFLLKWSWITMEENYAMKKNYVIEKNTIIFINNMWLPVKKDDWNDMQWIIKSIIPKKNMKIADTYLNYNMVYVWPTDVKVKKIVEEQVNDKTFTWDYDFRKVYRWMSPQQVKKAEDDFKYYDSEEWLMSYRWTLNGQEVDLIYKFIDNKLVSTYYMLNEEHTNYNEYIDDYKNLETMLSWKYWKNSSKNSKWVRLNNLFKDDYASWWMAISIWHLKYLSSRENKKTKINLFLRWDNYKIDLAIIYVGKEFENMVNEDSNKNSAIGL